MKPIIISLVITAVIIGGAVMLVTDNRVASTANVTQENETQVIAINVKGDYQPALTEAKAGVPSVLRMASSGVYSCALALKVPKLGFQQYLPPTGTTDIPVPPQKAGSSIKGICSMGMYNFEVKFI